MKKIKMLLAACAMFAFNGYAIASDAESGTMPVVSDLKVKLSAYGHFQAGLRNQNKLTSDDKKVSANRNSFAFFNDAALFADISNTMENDITYGGKIVLVPTAKIKGSPSYNGTHIYLESQFGRVEAGSPINAGSNMFLDAGSIASATGGDWERYAKFDSAYLKNGTTSTTSFATFDEFFLDSKLVTNIETRKYSTEPSRAISYYTPKFEFGNTTKLQLGVSYIPDSSNTGADTPDKNSSGTDKQTVGAQHFVMDKSVINAVSGGVTLEQNITDGVDLKIAFTGEVGKAAGKAELFDTSSKTLIASYKLKDLRTYNIGSVLNVGNFSYAASFGSLGKSLTTSAYHKAGRDTTYYTAGTAYKQGPFTASLNYFHSNQYKNTLECVTLGTDYKLAPGFKPYAEVSGFSLKGRPEFYPDLKRRKTRGTIAIIGAKLSL